MDEAELIKLIKLSVPTLLVVILVLFLLTVIKARLASDMARKTELDHENLKKEMELLAKNKLASRESDHPEPPVTEKAPEPENTVAPEEVVPAEVSDDKSDKDEKGPDGFIEGEPLA